MRSIQQIVNGMRTTDGAGVSLTRIIGSPEFNMLDPFLLLDEFSADNPNDYIAGFPPHPHRGFETITYMVKGKWQHKDSAGNEGILKDGSVQWMTAGSGVVHSEMPVQTDGAVRGFQLWLNLPQTKKMMDPNYQDIQVEQIPVDKTESSTVKVISGVYNKLIGPGRSQSPVLILDILLENNSELTIPLPDGWNTFAYIYNGTVESGSTIMEGQLATFSLNGSVYIKTETQKASIYLVAGEPLNEPVARGGPFVMNTKAEVLKAFEDYQNGRLQRQNYL